MNIRPSGAQAMWNVPGGACAANQVSVRAQLTDSGNLIGYVQMTIAISLTAIGL